MRQQVMVQLHILAPLHERGLEGVLNHHAFMLFTLPGKISAEVPWEYRLEDLLLQAIHTLCCASQLLPGLPFSAVHSFN